MCVFKQGPRVPFALVLSRTSPFALVKGVPCSSEARPSCIGKCLSSQYLTSRLDER